MSYVVRDPDPNQIFGPLPKQIPDSYKDKRNSFDTFLTLRLGDSKDLRAP